MGQRSYLTNCHLIWHRRIGTLAAASPALDIAHKLVFFTLLSRSSRLP